MPNHLTLIKPPQLIIDRVFEFFTEVQATIQQFDVKEPTSVEEETIKSLQRAFVEAEEEFKQLRHYGSTFFEAIDNARLREILAEQATEIVRLREQLTEKHEPPADPMPNKAGFGLFARDNLGQVFGPYKDEAEMRAVFCHSEPVKTWWQKEKEAEKPNLTKPPSDAERQLARAAIDRVQATAKRTGANAYEPPPKPSDPPAVWDLVMRDIQERDAFGEKKYGQRLKPFDGRDPLVDLYQELLDAVVYTRKAIYERAKMVELLKEAVKIAHPDHDDIERCEAFTAKVEELLR